MFAARALMAIFLCEILSASQIQAQAIVYHHRSSALGDSLAGAAELTAAQSTSAKNWAEAYSRWVDAEYDRTKYYEARKSAARQRREEEKSRLAERRLHNLQRQLVDWKSSRAEAEVFAQEIRSGAPRWPALFESHPYRQLRTEVEELVCRYRIGAPDEDSAGREKLDEWAHRARDMIRKNPTNAGFSNRLRAMRSVKLLELLADPIPPAILIAGN